MNKIIKYVLWAVGIVLVVIVGVGVYFAATFDPNDYKPQVIQAVKDKTTRTLALPGEIELAFFPKLGAKVGQASLSEPGGGKDFASVQSIRISLALLPLFKKQLVVDEVYVNGLRAEVVKRKDGSMNIDDLIKQEEKPDQPTQTELQFDIDHVTIEDSAASYRDEVTGKTYALQNIDLETGRVALGTAIPIDLSLNAQASEPKLNLDLKLETRVTFNPLKKQYAAENFELDAKGAALDISDLALKLRLDAEAQPDAKTFKLEKLALQTSGKQAGGTFEVKLDAPRIALADNKLVGEKIAASVNQKTPERTVNANFVIPGIEGNAQAFSTGALQAEIDAKLKDGALKAKLNAPLAGKLDEKTLTPTVITSNQLALDFDGKLGENAVQGKLSSPLIADLAMQQYSLDKLSAAVTANGPKLPNKRVSVDLNGSARADLAKKTVQTNLAGKLDQSQIKAKIVIANFDKPAYTFDVDIDKLDADAYLVGDSAKPAPAAAKPASAKPAPAAPLDFSALKDLNANGQLRIGTLTFSNIKSNNVKLELKANGGKVDISPLSANLYQGSLNGSVGLNAAAAAPQVAMKQNLSGVAIGPLLKDFNGTDTLEGKGNVALDLTAQGTTVEAMKRALNGTMAVKLHDGALKGINIAASLREAKATLGVLRGEKTEAADTSKKTDFTEMTASFAVRNGIAHNEDLSAKSPLLRLGGAGDINIPDQTLNYLAKATVVATSRGQGGAGLEQLKGITVPLRITGSFEEPQYKLDFTNLASEAAKQKLDEKKEEYKAKATEKLQEKVGDKLKGLFGK